MRNLKTLQDNVEFTKSVMEIAHLKKISLGPAQMKKCSDISTSLRTEGNTYFQIKEATRENNILAWKKYSQSMAYAPKNSPELALAFSNRSAVLFQMKKHLECIQDIDRVFGMKYPTHLRLRLLIRKTRCMMYMDRSSAQKTYDTFLQNMHKVYEIQHKLNLSIKKHYHSLKNIEK